MSLLLGLRLVIAGGREALLRLAFAAVGVGVGLTLLLLAMSFPSAADGRAERTSWRDAAIAVTVPDIADPPVESADGALFLAVSDYYDGTPMSRTYVAALGADPPVPPGLERLPRPGEVAVSPAMRRLLESTPDDQLDDRFPGRVTMTIGESGLGHDNELVAVIGRTPEQLRGVGSVREVRGFSVPVTFGIGGHSVLTPLLVFGVVLLLAPAAILVVMMTRFAAAQRDRRLASIRLVGATRTQTAVMAAAEVGLAAVAGSLLAWAGYEAGRRIMSATVVFQGGHFWLDDLGVSPWVVVLVLAGAPVLVVLAGVAALSGVQTRPLAVTRRGRPAPSVWSAMPLAAGIGGALALDPLRDLLGIGLAQLSVLVTLLTLVGFVLVGPWLCLVVSRGVARVVRSVPGLIAARRMAADPRATFRAVSGVVLAVTALTFLGSTGGDFSPFGQPDESRRQGLRPGVVLVVTGGVSQDRVAPLLTEQAVAVRGVSGWLAVPCVELARVRRVSCPHSPLEESGMLEPRPAAEAMGDVALLYIPTDGSLAAENRVRTQAANLVPNAIINSDRDPVDYQLETAFTDLDRLAMVAGGFVLLIGACSLTAGVLSGLLERRRPLALLRASGMRIGELRRVVFLETAATMVVTSVVGMGIGLVLAYASSRRSGGVWSWPEAEVFAYVGGGVLAALVFSALALPLLGITTRHHAVRYE